MKHSWPWFSGGGALLLAALLLHTLIVVDDLPDITHNVADLPENVVAVWGNHTIGQIVQPSLPNMSGVALSLRRPSGQRLSGTIVLRLRRSAEAADDLRVARIPAELVQDDRWTEFLFSPLDTRHEEHLYLFVEYTAGTEERPLLLRAEQREGILAQTERIVEYASGTLTRDHQAAPGDLAFQLLKRARRPFGLQVVGGAVLGGFSLLVGGVLCVTARRRWTRPAWSVPAALAVLGAGLPIIFYLPLLIHPTFLGVGDWDMNTTLHATAERALVHEQTFPGWNPYLCGGTPLAAFPEAPVFSPFFATVLLGGPVLGFKLNILLHGVLGFLGMLLWLRRGWKLSWLAAFLGAAVVMFSSFLGLHVAAGHSRKVAAAWIPWVLLFFQRAMGNELNADSRKRAEEHDRPPISSPQSALRSVAPAAVALALMLLDGSVYLSLYTATFVLLVGVVTTITRRRALPIVAALGTVLVAGLLSGAHLVPTLAYQATMKTVLEDETPALPLQALWHVFLDPNQRDDAQKFVGQTQPWIEYGAYVSLVPVLLGVIGVLTAWRSVLPWFGAGLFFLLVPLSETLQQGVAMVPILGALRNPQRMVGIVTVVIGLTAALGAERVARWLLGADPSTSPPSLRRAVHVALGVLVAITIGHLLFVNTETLANTFVIAPPSREEMPFRQGWARKRLVGIEDSFVFTMENTVRNLGSINRCSVASIRPTGALRISQSPSGEDVAAEFLDAPYLGEAFIREGQGTVTVEEHKTNRIRVRYQTSAMTRLALNENYHAGWRVRRTPIHQEQQAEPAFPLEGLVTTWLPPGSGTVIFSYKTPALGAGIFTSTVGLCIALWLWRRSGRRGTQGKHRHVSSTNP